MLTKKEEEENKLSDRLMNILKSTENKAERDQEVNVINSNLNQPNDINPYTGFSNRLTSIMATTRGLDKYNEQVEEANQTLQGYQNLVNSIEEDRMKRMVQNSNQEIMDSNQEIDEITNEEEKQQGLLKINRENINDNNIVIDNYDDANIEKLAKMDRKERYKEIRSKTINNDDFSKLNLKVEEYLQNQDVMKKSTKINEDIANNNFWSSFWHILSTIPTNALDAFTQFGATVRDISKNNFRNYNKDHLVDAAKLVTSKNEAVNSNINNSTVRTLGTVGLTLGDMAPSIAADAMAPGSGIWVSALNSGSSSYLETLNDEHSNKDKALLTGILKGATTFATEKLTGGNFLSRGSLDDVARKTIRNNFSSRIGKRIASKVYEFGGEMLEEQLENHIGYIIDKVVNDKDVTAEEWFNEFNETNKITLLTTMILSGFGLGGDTYKEVIKQEALDNIDTKTKESISEIQKIIEEDNLTLQNKKNDNTFYTILNTNNDGDIIGFTKTRGIEIDLKNDALHVSPVAVLDENGYFGVIDSDTGVKLDTPGYLTEQEAIDGYTKKMKKIDKATIENINNTVSNAKLNLINKVEQLKELYSYYNENTASSHRLQSPSNTNDITSTSLTDNNEDVKDNTQQVKLDSENFAKQIENIKNGNFPQKDMLTVLSHTPKPLQDIGLPDLPITMTQKHLDTIMNETGKYKNANYHNLGEDVVKQLPEAINNPLDIVKSNTKDDSVVLTTYLADKNNNTVIASIKIDGKGYVNSIIVDTNVMTSAYGKSNYEKFMEENLKNGNLLYDIDQGVIKKVTGARLQLPRSSNSESANARFQLPRLSNSIINNSVTYNDQNVNEITSTNNYNYMQNEGKRYTQEQFDDITKAIGQISNKAIYNNGATVNTLRTVSNNVENINLIEQNGNYYINALDNEGSIAYQQKISNRPYTGKQIKEIVNNAINNADTSFDVENVNTDISQTSQNENIDVLQQQETSYSPQDIKKIAEPFNSQEEYTKNEMAKVWNNEIARNEYDVSYDEDGNIQNYIAIEEDGNNLMVSLYDNNDNIVKSETISNVDGKYTSNNITSAIEKVSGLYGENRPIKGQHDIEGNEVRNIKKETQNKTTIHERKFETEINNYKKQSKQNNKINGNILEINTNVLKGISKKKQSSFMNEYLRHEVKGQDYFVDNEKIIANGTTIGKMKNGATNFDKRIDKYLRSEIKANAIANIDKILKISIVTRADRIDTKGHTFANTFDRRNSIFKYKNQKYDVMLTIGKKDGINTLYSIEKIKMTQKNRLILPTQTNKKVRETRKKPWTGLLSLIVV